MALEEGVLIYHNEFILFYLPVANVSFQENYLSIYYVLGSGHSRNFRSSPGGKEHN